MTLPVVKEYGPVFVDLIRSTPLGVLACIYILHIRTTVFVLLL